ncbi:hypothetical protein R5R35_003016 [Gryllus longicercus]|uniref:Pre-rRNA-processing protein TSR1 homolog n=1 Tax=Gryllus longicercus TaxID=2509291 RepID=A0AAN9ZA20_9ORTH
MGTDSVQQRHRPGLLKQQNKPHKHGRHRSKGAIEKDRKGRMAAKALSKKVRRDLRKDERRHQATQIRRNKREEVLLKKRALGSATSPPFITALVALCQDVNPFETLKVLKEADSEAEIEESAEGYIHLSVPRFKQRFTFVVPGAGDLYSVLDTLKVADTVMFLLSAASRNGIDPEGEIILNACMSQGLPSPIFAVAHSKSNPSLLNDVKSQLQKVIDRWLPDNKVMSFEKNGAGLNALRRIGSQKQRSVIFRDRRPHLLAESVTYVPDTEGPLGTLKVSGYVRGMPLSVNSLVHIPGWGDFQMSQITAPEDPFPLSKSGRSCDKIMEGEEEKLLERVDPNRQESLVSENIPDPMEGEQTWPTEEELKEAEEQQKKKKKVKRIPKGMSEYQAAWIPDSDAEEISESEDDEYFDADAGASMDAKSESESEESMQEQDEEEYETVTMSEFGRDAERYDEKMDLTEEEEARQKLKDAHTDKIFPDEIDTPLETPARVRFQKYRGLQSFRTSPWDPKENLPIDYAKIFQFENFNRTRKRVFKNLEEEEEGVVPGWYVTLHLINVPSALVESRSSDHPLIVYGMLPHEQKMSVVNILLKRPTMISSEQEPIKSKEQLIFHCGYRRFKACPIFSQHTNGTKHKYERYFQPDATVIATVFAPIVFPPCPTLAFKQNSDGSQDLVGVGSVLSVNPDRIVAKRVVLSGYPFKVHKRTSVIRFMFFNREDIEWFKPVELKTKHGRRGHIKEPLGTHGHMKCVFDGQLKSQDTILMCLYKRVFPKWTYELCLDSPPALFNHTNREDFME